jgi:prophage DNA circulation protein
VAATFKGIEFRTDSHDTKGGRRLVVKQFPGREDSEVEDLGGKAGEFRLNAYFIGADYDLARDAFLDALNKPGADWLVHPWRGRLWVRARYWSVHESNDKGGFCTIGVDFVTGGGDVAAPSADRTDIAAASIGGFADAVVAEFDLVPMSADSMGSMIATVQGKLDTVRNMISLATLPLTMLGQVRNVIDGLKGDVAALLALPAQYAAALRSFANLLGAGDSALSDTSIPQVVGGVAALTGQPVAMSSGAGVSPALYINLQRDADLRGRLLLVSAAQLALADYRSADDRDAALASVLGALDAMLPGMSDAVFQAALDMRAALIEALMAQELSPASVRDVVQAIPATVLAHRMEVDEAVFLARNKVRHPLFVRGRVRG